jgi:hypothetical protein
MPHFFVIIRLDRMIHNKRQLFIMDSRFRGNDKTLALQPLGALGVLAVDYS